VQAPSSRLTVSINEGCLREIPQAFPVYTKASAKNEVLGFISRFTSGGRKQEVIEAFTCGCCYWFAAVLAARFQSYSPEIVYDEIINHFGTRISGRVYDITGDITDQYDWVNWCSFADALQKERIIRDCIMFER